MRLIFVGDPHYRSIGKGSRYRIDNYYQTQLEKLHKILQLGSQHAVDGVIFLGDVFHTPREDHQLVKDLMSVIKQYNVRIFTIVGNHDVTGYQLTSLNLSPLGVLIESGLVTLLDEYYEFANNLVLKGIHYKSDHAINDYNFPDKYHNYLKIIAAHTMIIPQDSVLFSHIHPDQIKTNGHIIISGHYHHSFDYTTPNLVRYINPGIPMRWTMDEKDLIPKVLLLLVNFADGIHTYTTQYISLGAKPVNDVFNVTKVAELKEKEQIIENFVRTLENTTFLSDNLEETILKFGRENNIEKEIVDNLLKRIQEKRGSKN